MACEGRSYCIYIDSSESEDEYVQRAATSKSKNETMFQFLKRKRTSKATTPSRKGSQHNVQDENVPPSPTYSNAMSARPSVLNIEKPSHYTFASFRRSPGGESKFSEQSLPSYSLKLEQSQLSSESKVTSMPLDQTLTQMFSELSDKCNSFAQAGLDYKSATEYLMAQAIELTKSLQEPALKKKQSHLRSAWTAVQNLFREFQAMDASEAVNNLRLAVREHIKNTEVLRMAQQEANKREVSTQVDDPELVHLREYINLVKVALNNHEKEQIRRYQYSELNLARTIEENERYRYSALAEMESLHQYIFTLKQRIKVEQLLNESAKMESLHGNITPGTTERTELYKECIEKPKKVDAEVEVDFSPKKASTTHSQYLFRVGLEPESKGRVSMLTHQLHSTAEELYEYWSALRAVQRTLAGLRLYHKVSQHYEEISFNERLYV